MKAPVRLIRVSVDGKPSAARATLEDYGMLAQACLHLGLATGEVRYAVAGRALVDATLADGRRRLMPFAVPGGADPVLAGHGLAIEADPSEGAYASGLSAMASAAHRLYLLTADAGYLTAATSAMEQFAPLAVAQPMAFRCRARRDERVDGRGQSARGREQRRRLGTGIPRAGLVSERCRLDGADGCRSRVVRGRRLRAVRGSQHAAGLGHGKRIPTAYLCRDFVCRLPLTQVAELERSLTDVR